MRSEGTTLLGGGGFFLQYFSLSKSEKHLQNDFNEGSRCICHWMAIFITQEHIMLNCVFLCTIKNLSWHWCLVITLLSLDTFHGVPASKSNIFLEWLDQVDKARGKLLHISYNAKYSLDTMKLAQVWLGSLITMPTYSLRVEPPFVFLMRRKKGSSNSTFYWSMFILDLQNDGLTLLDYIKCEHHKYLGNQVWCDWTMISNKCL